MAVSPYRVPDEPLPSGLAQYAVDPMWPLLALMLSGNAFGLAWFIINGFALGSPTRTREWTCIATSVVGSGLLLLLLGAAESNGWLHGAELRYAALTLLALKLGMGYALYMTQQACFEIWEHYGGKPRNGLPVLIVLSFFGRNLLASKDIPVFLAGILQ